MTDLCLTCGDRWCTTIHDDPWEREICLHCGASWQCEHRGGGDATGEWRVSGGPLLRQVIEQNPVDESGSLDGGSQYRRDLREDQFRDAQYTAVPGGHVRRPDRPTIWPRPGWRDQSAA